MIHGVGSGRLSSFGIIRRRGGQLLFPGACSGHVQSFSRRKRFQRHSGCRSMRGRDLKMEILVQFIFLWLE
jgi:hypothetical protein